MQAVSTLAVIPARAGSRGLPGKHLRRIGGVAMIVHTIRAALGAATVDRVIVSTNDAAVARVARRAGAEVPFERPKQLAEDDTPTQPVIEHAVAWAEANGTDVDVVVTLQPTSPLRDASQIDAAVRLLDGQGVRSVASVATLGMPSSVVGTLAVGRFTQSDPGDHARRQDSPAAVRLTGGIYVTRRDLLREGRLLDERPAALVVDPRSAVDVDTQDDLVAARRGWRAARQKRGDGR
jgi:CMP-N,N'-diacetyllegionaminic acid synthase